MPSFLLSVAQRPSTLHKNLLLDMSASVGLGATMAVVAVLLPSIARLDGLGALGLATLAAIPFVANLLSLLAGRIGPRTPRGLAIIRALGSAALLLVFVAPGPIVIALATFAFWMAFALGAPLQQRIWTGMYPSNRRGELLGIVGTGRFAAGTVALMVIGLVIDGAVGLTVIAVVAVIGALSALATSRLALPADEPIERYSIRDSLRSVARNPKLRGLGYAQLAFGGGLVAAPALVAIVQVDRLGLGLDDIALAGLATYLTIALAYGLWGRVANRIGGLRTVAFGGWLGVVSLLLFAYAPNLAVVIVASSALGATLAAIDVSWPLIIAQHAPRDEQSSAAASLMAMMGLRGLIAPFLVMVPVQLGLIDVTGGLMVCAAAVAIGALLYAWVGGVLHVPTALPVRARAVAAMIATLLR